MAFINMRIHRLHYQLHRTYQALDKLYNTYDELAASMVGSYDFNSGEGEQRTVRIKLKEVMDQIYILEMKAEHLVDEINSTGLVSIRVRRKQPQLRHNWHM